MKWRINYCITYPTQTLASRYREIVLDTIYNVSSLVKIDLAIKRGHVFDYGNTDISGTSLRESVSDIVYFRSSPQTKVSIKDFRVMMRCIFHDYELIPDPFELFPMLQKSLPEFPFPGDFLRFLEYPYVEAHKGGHKSLTLLARSVLPILEEEQDASLN